jgi:hypothetical protein
LATLEPDRMGRDEVQGHLLTNLSSGGLRKAAVRQHKYPVCLYHGASNPSL